MQVVLPTPRLPRPCRPAKPRLPVARRRTIRPCIGPDIPVGLGIGPVLPAFLKPRMIRRRVRPHLVDDHFQASLVRRLQQCLEVIKRPEQRIDLAIVGDVIPEIAHRALEERRQPHPIDAQRLHMIQLCRNTLEVADAIAIRVHERAGIDLVEHRTAPPASRFVSRHARSPGSPGMPIAFLPSSEAATRAFTNLCRVNRKFAPGNGSRLAEASSTARLLYQEIVDGSG